MESKIVKKDFGNLDKFVKSLTTDYVVRVGILGKDTNRKEAGLTNAQIGYWHEREMGGPHYPQRSFLRMPIFRYADFIVNETIQSGAGKLLAKGDIKGVLKLLGHSAEGVIKNAFYTAGFGEWKPNAPSTIAKKGSSSPLIDTGQLRRSISSDVVKRS